MFAFLLIKKRECVCIVLSNLRTIWIRPCISITFVCSKRFIIANNVDQPNVKS